MVPARLPGASRQRTRHRGACGQRGGGPGLSSTGFPPGDTSKDWLALARRVPETVPLAMEFPGVPGVSGLATWPKGRLVALQADGEGEFATVFVVPPGDRLRVNADVAPSGYLKVAVRIWSSGSDLPGRTFAESDRVIGNSLGHPARWKGEDTIGHRGRPIMLRVQMKQARLFGFEFVE